MIDNPIHKFIINNEIFISEENWNYINSLYDKETIISFITEEIIIKNIKLPLKNLTINDARNSYIDLCNYTCNEFQYDTVFSRYEYNYKLSNKYLTETNVGNNASDYFQQYNRYCCGSVNSPSPVRTWENKKFLHGLLSALWTLKYKEINSNSLKTALALRKYIASQYKPSLVKSILEKYNAIDVLDFSAGWGDRLCGFYSCKNTKSYIGIDPNKNVYEKYFEQIKLYKEISGEKKVILYNSSAEDITLEENIVDTIFTSPPYYNIERYTEEDNQSFKKYKKFDVWLNKFLFATLKIVWKALKPNGKMIINISDVYSNHTINKICDSMNDYIKNELHGKYVEGIGMKMMKRPNSGALKNKNGVFVEPIWVWEK